MLPLMLDAAPPANELLAEKAYDSDAIREDLLGRGMRPIIPNKDDRRFFHPFDRKRYRDRNAIDRMFRRLKDFRRIATRHDKLARNYLASLCLAALGSCWLR
jgi:transposase